MAGITNDKIAVSAEEVSAAIEQQSTKSKDILGRVTECLSSR